MDERRYLSGPGAEPDAAPRAIGQGAFGRVLLVYDARLGREVALKELRPFSASAEPDSGKTFGRSDSGATLPPSGALDATAGWSAPPAGPPPEIVTRFLREARLTARLEHPGIVPVHDLGQREDGSWFYTMKPIRGTTLSTAIAEARDLAGRLELLDAFLDLCQAVAYAHSRGVIHRDLKPQNAMVGAFGETVLLDWGLAKDRSGHDELGPDAGGGDGAETRVGALLGSPSYMSPEAAWGRTEEVDERADVFGLGAILYEILTGRPPYTGHSAGEVLERAREARPTPPHTLERDVPRELSSVVLRALAASPADRYPEPLTLAADVRAWRDGRTVGAHRYTAWEKLQRGVARHGARLAVGGLVLLILLAVVAFFSRQVSLQRDRARDAEALAQDQLAATLIAQATDAVALGSAAEALVAAAGALALREDPAARGALVAGASGMLQQLRWKAPLAGQPIEVHWHPVAGVLVLEEDRVERFTSDGAPLPPLTGLAEIQPRTMDVSPDGRRVAVSGHGAILVFTPGERTDAPTARLPTYPGNTFALAWVDDDHLLAGDRTDGVSLWEVSKADRLSGQRGQREFVRALAVRDGLAVSGAHDSTIKAWDAKTGEEAVALEPAHVGAFSVAISPDRALAAAAGEVLGGDGRVRVWDLRTGELLDAFRAHRGEVLQVRFSPDGRWLASGGGDEVLRLWSTADRVEVSALRSHGGRTPRFAFSPDGAALAVAFSAERELRAWSVALEQGGLALLRLAGPALHLDWSPDGTRLAFADVTLDARTGAQTRLTNLAYGGKFVWLTRDLLLVTELDWTLSAVDPTTDQRRARFAPESGRLLPVSESSPGGERLLGLVPGDGARFLRLDDPTLPLERVDCAALLGWEQMGDWNLSPDGAWQPDGSAVLLPAGERGLLRVPVDGTPCARVGPPDLAPSAVAVSSDGRTAALYADGETRLYALPDWTLQSLLEQRRAAGTTLQFTPDGRWLLATDWSGLLSAWRVAEGTLGARWKAHDNRIYEMSLSPDGRRLATTSADRSVRVWLLDALYLDRGEAAAWVERRTGERVAGLGE